MSESPHLPSDDLLGSLGAIAREEDNEHPSAWEDVVAGLRTTEDVRRERGDADGEHGELYAELFAPASEQERARLTDILADALKSDANHSPAPISLADHRTKRRTRGGWIAGLATLVAAAGILLWVQTTPPSGGIDLPTYELTVRNRTVEAKRSGDSDPTKLAKYHPDSAISWVLSPQTQHSEAISVAVVALPVDAGEPHTQILKNVQVQPSGAISIEGSVADVLELQTGVWDIWLVVGASEHLPTSVEAAQALVATPPAEVEVVKPYRLQVVPR